MAEKDFRKEKQGSLNEFDYQNTLIRGIWMFCILFCPLFRAFSTKTPTVGPGRDHQMGTLFFFFVAGKIKLDARIYGM